MTLAIWLLGAALALTAAAITIGRALNPPGRHRRPHGPRHAAAAHASPLPTAGKLPADPDPYNGYDWRP